MCGVKGFTPKLMYHTQNKSAAKASLDMVKDLMAYNFKRDSIAD